MHFLVAIWIVLLWLCLSACGAADSETAIQIEEKPAKHLRERNGNSKI
jgi:hypothetical protein